MSFFPPFDFNTIFLDPWSTAQLVQWNGKVILMGLLVCWTSGILGAFIVVRRMALMGDAISHGILPGLVISFLICGSLEIGPMLIGACSAGLACSFCIEWLRSHTPIRQDASMAIVFTTFFAVGVTLINLETDHLDLDTGCILYGEIGLTPLSPDLHFMGLNYGNQSIWLMGAVCVFVLFVICLFYKQLLLTSFDPTLAHSFGWPVKIIHLGLMLMLALSTVASMEAVGVILVVAMLVFPCVTASFFSNRLPTILLLTFPLGTLYTIGGFHLAHWLDCSIAAAMAIAATIIFVIVCVISPKGIMLKYKSD
jgi:manganese/zinc/iron transport system permease protein